MNISDTYRMLRRSGWRELIIRRDRRRGSNRFDFSDENGKHLDLGPDVSDGYYDPVAAAVESAFSHYPIEPNSSVINIGSGKARAMIALARFPFRRVDGVEGSSELVDIGRRNLARAYLYFRSEIFTCCPTKFDGYDSYNYFYFHAPYREETLGRVLSNIEQSIQRKPRECLLAYCSAEPEMADEMIKANGTFESSLNSFSKNARIVAVFRHVIRSSK